MKTTKGHRQSCANSLSAGQQLQAADAVVGLSQPKIDWGALADIRQDWECCLGMADMVDFFGDLMIAKLAAGERMTAKQYEALDYANTKVSEAMVWVTSEAKRLTEGGRG